MDDRSRIDDSRSFAPLFFWEKAKPDEKPRVRNTSPVRAAVLLSLAVLIGLATYRFVTTDRPPQNTKSRPTTAQPVGAATVDLGAIRVEVHGLGGVTPLATITVKTQVNGQLMDVAFKEGQLVKKGDTLAQIDPRPYQLTRAQYEGQLIHDQGLLDQARMNLTRYDNLMKQNSVARQTAEDQIYLVKQYEGSIKSDQALIDAQDLNLTYAHIVSPINGRVGLRLVDPGNYVQATDTGIAVLTQLQPISVIFTVPEDDIPDILTKMEAEEPLEVTIYDRANANKLATGKVTTIDNEIDTTTGTVKIRAEFPNLDNKLFPNQFVNASLLVKSLNNVVRAPLTAIQRGAPGTYVYTISPDNKVSIRKVALGAQDDGKVEILSGLAPGEHVVVDGADRLRENASVFVAARDGVPVAGSEPSESSQGEGGAGSGRRGKSQDGGPKTSAPGGR